MKKEDKDFKTCSEINDKVNKKKGTAHREQSDREFNTIKIGLLLRQARMSKNMTQEELAKIIDKKRTYISRVENDGSNITLKTLFEIVEKGLGGKVEIGINV
ncbi:MAG: helix-turn-helix transcriptional regulator [Bacteroidales bacterium]|nr:helix-turn-helix transcriptional regulator [Bacteroidales bacterium]